MPGTVDGDRDSILLPDRDCEGAAVEGPPRCLQHLPAYSKSREVGPPCCQSGRDAGKSLLNGENTARVPPTAGPGGGENASLKRQCRKTPDKGFPRTQRSIPSCTYSFPQGS